jgi:hypothetical protein
MTTVVTRLASRVGRRRRLLRWLAPYRLGPMGPHAARAYVKDLARGGRRICP